MFQDFQYRVALLSANTSYSAFASVEILRSAILDLFPKKIALVSSFGAEAAVLLHMVASIDNAVPVIFIDTGKLFGETKRYRDQLVERLNLADVRVARASSTEILAADPNGSLWRDDPDACCALRKVNPLRDALAPFSAWINGRKRHHGDTRSTIRLVEREDLRIKLNPLAHWTRTDVEAYFSTYELPHHPLVADGFASIGCTPCTARVKPGEDIRAGRWRGVDKTECGIHQMAGTRPE